MLIFLKLMNKTLWKTICFLFLNEFRCIMLVNVCFINNPTKHMKNVTVPETIFVTYKMEVNSINL